MMTCVGCIDPRLAHCWSKLPLCMVIDGGGCPQTCAEVKPGHMVNHPHLMASHKVDKTGDNRDAW
jgi:hypothetical protein